MTNKRSNPKLMEAFRRFLPTQQRINKGDYVLIDTLKASCKVLEATDKIFIIMLDERPVIFRVNEASAIKYMGTPEERFKRLYSQFIQSLKTN